MACGDPRLVVSERPSRMTRRESKQGVASAARIEALKVSSLNDIALDRSLATASSDDVRRVAGDVAWRPEKSGPTSSNTKQREAIASANTAMAAELGG